MIFNSSFTTDILQVHSHGVPSSIVLIKLKCMILTFEFPLTEYAVLSRIGFFFLTIGSEDAEELYKWQPQSAMMGDEHLRARGTVWACMGIDCIRRKFFYKKSISINV